MSTSVRSVGFIGLGLMGKSIARNLLKAGFPLVVHNRSRPAVDDLAAEGAVPANSPAEVAGQVDVMIVVGGHNSGNTTRLAEISRSVNPRTHHVETAEELEAGWFEDAATVGVTAGASTPDEQIRGVISAIEALDA